MVNYELILIYIRGTTIFYDKYIMGNEKRAITQIFERSFHDDPIHFPVYYIGMAKVDGLYFKGRTSIYMKEDGTLIIWNPGLDEDNEEPPKSYDLPKNGVIYVDNDNSESADSNNIFDKSIGNVFISGNLKGRLTVAAANNIYITDFDPTIKKFSQSRSKGQTNGVTYKSTKFNKKEDGFIAIGNDMLGLIANNDVVILTKGWFDDTWGQVAWGDIYVRSCYGNWWKF